MRCSQPLPKQAAGQGCSWATGASWSCPPALGGNSVLQQGEPLVLWKKREHFLLLPYLEGQGKKRRGTLGHYSPQSVGLSPPLQRADAGRALAAGHPTGSRGWGHRGTHVPKKTGLKSGQLPFINFIFPQQTHPTSPSLTKEKLKMPNSTDFDLEHVVHTAHITFLRTMSESNGKLR